MKGTKTFLTRFALECLIFGAGFDFATAGPKPNLPKHSAEDSSQKKPFYKELWFQIGAPTLAIVMGLVIWKCWPKSTNPEGSDPNSDGDAGKPGQPPRPQQPKPPEHLDESTLIAMAKTLGIQTTTAKGRTFRQAPFDGKDKKFSGTRHLRLNCTSGDFNTAKLEGEYATKCCGHTVCADCCKGYVNASSGGTMIAIVCPCGQEYCADKQSRG